MAFNRFRILCLVRILLLTGTLVLFLLFVLKAEAYVTIFLIGLAALIEIYSLFRYVERTGRNLVKFMESIRQSDFVRRFDVSPNDAPFGNLSIIFNEVMDKIQKARSEQEEQFQYLRTVMQHVNIGLVSFRSNGEVEMINTAAKHMLNLARLNKIGDLELNFPALKETILKLKPGDRSLVRIEINGEVLHLSLAKAEFKLGNREYALVSLHNIHSELEEKEMEAWQNLIRVLTHEIVNSITPIASLAATVNKLLPENEPGYDAENLNDIRGAMQTIQKRSEGLLHFVDIYRNLTRIPTPQFKIFPVRDFFERIEHLMHNHMENGQIKFIVSIYPESLEITADPVLMEQVVINLVLNAVQANENRPSARIELRAGIDERGRTFLQVADNGPGIMKEVMEKIFIPFFTTKREGSGIGLSLARQIMRLHNGTISAQSEPDVETVFTLKL
jgi:two-component system, NtrC family, nitrogen regulation sensor histidine kinase NtrY